MGHDYITTYTKKHVTPWAPKNSDIFIEDIAHALSYLCRGNGHGKFFYTVGQHSINCVKEARARGFSARVQMGCLLHDGTEAYLSDVTRPVKQYLSVYRDMEEKLQTVIFEVFGIGDFTKEENHLLGLMDDTLLYYEFLALFDEVIPIKNPEKKGNYTIETADMLSIENEFLEWFYLLQKELSSSI